MLKRLVEPSVLPIAIGNNYTKFTVKVYDKVQRKRPGLTETQLTTINYHNTSKITFNALPFTSPPLVSAIRFHYKVRYVRGGGMYGHFRWVCHVYA